MTRRLKLPKTIVIPEGIIANQAPTKIQLSSDWYEVLIGIGNDHTARLLIDEDALRALKELTPETYIK